VAILVTKRIAKHLKDKEQREITVMLMVSLNPIKVHNLREGMAALVRQCPFNGFIIERMTIRHRQDRKMGQVTGQDNYFINLRAH